MSNSKSLSPAQIRQRYGPEIAAALTAIRRGQAPRKRRTLLALADAVMLGHSREEVYKDPLCLNRRTHYRLMRDDEQYRQAFMLLIGTEDEPGAARQMFMNALDEETAASLSVLNAAVNTLVDSSAKAALALLDGLQAEEMKLDMKGGEHYAPDNRTRLQAARALFEIVERWRKVDEKEADELNLHIFLPDNLRDVGPDINTPTMEELDIEEDYEDDEFGDEEDDEE